MCGEKINTSIYFMCRKCKRILYKRFVYMFLSLFKELRCPYCGSKDLEEVML